MANGSGQRPHLQPPPLVDEDSNGQHQQQLHHLQQQSVGEIHHQQPLQQHSFNHWYGEAGASYQPQQQQQQQQQQHPYNTDVAYERHQLQDPHVQDAQQHHQWRQPDYGGHPTAVNNEVETTPYETAAVYETIHQYPPPPVNVPTTSSPTGDMPQHSPVEAAVLTPSSSVRMRPHSTPETLHWLDGNYELAEGVCIPRNVVYFNYVDFCSKNHMQPVNAASFGKIIRQMFANLTTRRLGTRGQSRYHYYGLAVKADSIYYSPNYSSKKFLDQ